MSTEDWRIGWYGKALPSGVQVSCECSRVVFTFLWEMGGEEKGD